MLNLILQIVIFLAGTTLMPTSHAKVLTQKDLAIIVHELTTNSARQQIALDKLARSEDELLKYLPNYFSDKRKVADTNVRFLNTHPKAMEKYFLTYATTVDEVIIQYFCFRTEQCVPTVDPDELEKIRSKFSRHKSSVLLKKRQPKIKNHGPGQCRNPTSTQL